MNAGPRGTEVYLQRRTKRRLFWIRELVNQPPKSEDVKTTEQLCALVDYKPKSVDEIADQLLNEKMEENYPNIKILEKRLDALEGQLIVELLTPTTET